jgi:RHS repeat-associated protein
VRGVVNNTGSLLEHRHFDPFGTLFGGAMAQSEYGFTGEPFDSTSGLLYLRARHYRPGNGTFASRDPFEGMMSRPMSRNGYSWVEGRVADGRDPSGYFAFIVNGSHSIGGSYTEGLIEHGDWLYCIGRQGGLADSQLQQFAERVVELNGRDNPAFRWYGNTCSNPATDLPCLAPNFILKIPNSIDPIGTLAGSTCNSLPLLSPVFNIGVVGWLNNKAGSTCGRAPAPSQPTPTLVPSTPMPPNYIVGGIGIAGQMQFNLSRIPGAPSIGISMEASEIAFPTFDPRSGVYKFISFGVACGVTFNGSRTAQIVSPVNVSAGVGLNLRLGMQPVPNRFGEVTYGTTGGGTIPYWGVANVQGDISFDPTNNSFSLGLGVSTPGLPSLTFATSASVCVGNQNTDWRYLPPEAYAGIEEAIYGIVGFCVQ